MQNFRQISLIGLRGCFPVVHCDIIARPSDLPVFCFINHALLVIDLPVASLENLAFSARLFHMREQVLIRSSSYLNHPVSV